MSAPVAARWRPKREALAVRARQVTSRSLWAAYLCGFVAGLDATSQFFIFPAIRDQLANGDAARASWILTVSGIVGAAILLQAGRLADRFGHDRLLLAGAIGFCVFTAAAAAAPTITVLVIARGLQSAGLAAIGVSSIAVIVRDSPAERLATAMGTWGFWTSMSGLVGPVLSATIVDATSWRWLFVAELPVALTLIALAAPGWSAQIEPKPGVGVDWVGMALAVGGLALVVLSLLEGNDWGWGSTRLIGALLVGAGCIAAVLHRSGHHRDPVIPLHLFHNASFDLSLGIGFLSNTAFYAMWLAALTLMTDVWDYSVLRAGLLLTIMPATMSLVSVRAGATVDRIGFRRVMAGGALLFSAGWMVLGVWVESEPGLHLLIPALIASGVAMGTVVSPTTAAGTRTLASAHVGTGTAIIQTMQRTGGAMGSAVVVVVIDAGTAGELSTHRATVWVVAALAAAVAALSLFLTPTRTARDVTPTPVA